MVTSLRRSWPLLSGLVVVYLGAPLLTRLVWFQRLTGDPKGIGAILFYIPAACFAMCLIGSYLYGFSVWRPVLGGVLAVVPWLAYFDGAVQVDAVAGFCAAYLVGGFIGEGLGALGRRIVRRGRSDSARPDGDNPAPDWAAGE